MASLNAVLCASAENLAENRWVVWGDVNKDNVVNLDDLVLLGQQWDETLDRYAAKNTTIAGDIQTHWRQMVPLDISEAARKGNFGPQLMANISPGAKAFFREEDERAYIEKLRETGYDTKAFSFDTGGQQIGFAVDVPAGADPVIRLRQQVFNVPVVDGVTPLIRANFANVPGGFTQAGQRYELPVNSTSFNTQYIYNYNQELDMLNYDVELKAKYAAFSGTVDIDGSSLFYADRTQHKILMRITQSFGWEHMPADAMVQNFTTSFSEDLAKWQNGENVNLSEKYGEFVATAAHRARSIVVEIVVNTRTEIDREDFSAKVGTRFDSPQGDFFDLKATVETFKSTESQIKDITVAADTIGGPVNLTLDIETTDPVTKEKATTPVTKAVEAWLNDIATGANGGIQVDPRLWNKFLNAWLGATSFENSVYVDFIYQPIMDIVAGPDQDPFKRAASLRAWYQKYAEVDQELARANRIMTTLRAPLEGELPDPDTIKIRLLYDYIGATAAFSDNGTTWEGFPSMRAYLANQYIELVRLYFRLFEKGQKIYSSKAEAPEVFRPQELSWALPEFFAPQIGLSMRKIYWDTINWSDCAGPHPELFTEQCVTATWEVDINDITLVNQERYELVYFLDFSAVGLGQYRPCVDGGDKWTVTRLTDKKFRFTLSLRAQLNIPCDRAYEEWYMYHGRKEGSNLGSPKFYVGLKDTKAGGEVVFAVESREDGAVEVFEPGLQILENSGATVPLN